MTTTAVVVVNYNTCDQLRPCLASIRDAGAARVIVVDNASTDGSQEMVRACFPQVTLHTNRTNIGYGAAANQAIAHCRADYILLLNSDTLVPRHAVHALQRYLDEHPQAAVVGPRLINADGTLQPSCYPFPTPFNLFLEESLLGRLAVYIPGVRDRYLRAWPHDTARPVPWVLGAALAIRREAFLDVNGFDPAYFMYYEETDLCYRLYMAGWQTHFAPVTTITHLGGASTSQVYAEMQYRLFLSAQRFFRRHYTAAQVRQLRLVMIPILVAQIVRDTLRYHRARQPQQRQTAWETVQARYRMLRECVAAPADYA